jgi:hypothetical protein
MASLIPKFRRGRSVSILFRTQKNAVLLQQYPAYPKLYEFPTVDISSLVNDSKESWTGEESVVKDFISHHFLNSVPFLHTNDHKWKSLIEERLTFLGLRTSPNFDIP